MIRVLVDILVGASVFTLGILFIWWCGGLWPNDHPFGNIDRFIGGLGILIISGFTLGICGSIGGAITRFWEETK